jgi:hypothetical protein
VIKKKLVRKTLGMIKEISDNSITDEEKEQLLAAGSTLAP